MVRQEFLICCLVKYKENVYPKLVFILFFQELSLKEPLRKYLALTSFKFLASFDLNLSRRLGDVVPGVVVYLHLLFHLTFHAWDWVGG